MDSCLSKTCIPPGVAIQGGEDFTAKDVPGLGSELGYVQLTLGQGAELSEGR